MKVILILLLISCSAWAQRNQESRDFSFEYGVTQQALQASEKVSDTSVKLTSNQDPYWLASFSFKFTRNFALKLFGGINLVKFNKSVDANLTERDQILNQFGLEIFKKSKGMARNGFFVMQQDHPQYIVLGPTDFAVTKKSFLQAGWHFSLGQRRRIGFLWGLGIKAFAMAPVKGGNIATEGGAGGEGYARLGWVGPFGLLYQLKGTYQSATTPNSDSKFTHDILSYCLQVNLTF